MYADETSEQCHWHIPEAHYLECWSDIRAFDGTATIGQPLIAPLFGARSSLELLSGLLEPTPLTSFELVKATWQRWHAEKKLPGDYETFWRRCVHAGLVAGSQLPVEPVRLADDLVQKLPRLELNRAPGRAELARKCGKSGRNRFQARSSSVRWPVREQWVVARNAPPADKVDLG